MFGQMTNIRLYKKQGHIKRLVSCNLFEFNLLLRIFQNLLQNYEFIALIMKFIAFG